jgi:hypothetical protein
MDTVAQLEELRLTIGVLALVMLAVVMLATARNAAGATSPRFGRAGLGLDDADDAFPDLPITERSGRRERGRSR